MAPREEAIPALLEEHGGKLYRLAAKLCSSPEEAEDLVQETFMQAWRKWDQFEGRSSPISWLYTIASRLCQRFHRKRAGEPDRKLSLEEVAPFDSPQMPDYAGVLDSQVRREGRERLEEAMVGLPIRYRLPLVLKEIVGLSYPEISAVLDVKEGTVKSRVHRGRMELRRALEVALPSKPGVPAAYPRQVCLDLLQAKQEAMDKDLPFPAEVVCDRCASVFASLDLAHDLCAQIGKGPMPRDLRHMILTRMQEASSQPET